MKILIKGSLGVNGIAQVTMNYCEKLKNENSYEFVVCETPKLIRKDFIEICNNNGWKIHYMPSQVTSIIRYKRALKNIFKSYKPDIYHINGNSCLMCIDVLLAKKYVKNIITHCHSTSTKFPVLNKLLKPMLKKQKILRLACSKEAALWAYGNSECILLRNAIDYNRFKYSEIIRTTKRKELHLRNDELVILQVGNFEYEKNQIYSIKLFEMICKKNKNIKMVFCGEGEDRYSIKKYVEN
ncbi:MAG: glycosyltransferase, partial [Lachnospiraceae bacterium]|nr:glycosyltransferase [Lachnospiraceae bacterium]